MSWFGEAKKSVGSLVEKKATQVVTDLLQSPRTKIFLQGLVESPDVQNAGKNLAFSVGKGLLDKKGLELFQGTGNASQILLKMVNSPSGAEGISSHLLALVSAGKADDGIFSFIESEFGQRVLGTASAMGEGAGTQLLDNLADSAYREWLIQNPPPQHPDVRGIEQYHLVSTQNERLASVFVCSYCQNRQNHSGTCEHCQATDFRMFISKPNPEWQNAMDELREWEQKSDAKKSELNISGSNKSAVVAVGAALAVLGTGAVAGFDPGQFLSQFGIGGASGRSPEALATVKNTLQGGGTTEYKVISVDSTRLSGENPKQLLQKLRQKAQEKIKLDYMSDVSPSILCSKINLGRGAKVEGSLVCLETCFVQNNKAEINGDLIVFGSLKAFDLPKITGTIYLVVDQENGVQATVDNKSAQVIHCTIDKAYQLAKEVGLI